VGETCFYSHADRSFRAGREVHFAGDGRYGPMGREAAQAVVVAAFGGRNSLVETFRS